MGEKEEDRTGSMSLGLIRTSSCVNEFSRETLSDSDKMTIAQTESNSQLLTVKLLTVKLLTVKSLTVKLLTVKLLTVKLLTVI